MGRQKKIKSVQVEEKKLEVVMTEEAVLESLQTEIDLARVELEKTKIEIEMKKKELELLPRREITEQERMITEKQVTNSNEMKSLKEKIDAQKIYDNEKITGRFMNRRAPGNSVKLAYIKYADDPVKWYNFEDGKVYTIPRGFANQINEHYYKPGFIQKEGEMDPNKPSTAIHEIDTSNKIYAFVPVNF